MSLKARIRGLEAKVEWLEMWGELRRLELLVKYQDKKRQLEDRLAADPKAAALFVAAGITSIRPTPRPAPPPPAPPPPEPKPSYELLPPPPEPVKKIASPAGGGGPQDRRGTRSLNGEIVGATNTESPSALRAPPPAEEEIARALQREHMQIAPVRWRQRTLQDDLDDEDYYAELDGEEEYDPFEHA